MNKFLISPRSILFRIACLLTLLVSGSFGFSAEVKPSVKPAIAVPSWKVPSHAWLLKRIPPPPAPNSPAGKADLEKVIRLQAAATPKQIALAQWDYKLNVFTYSEVLGKNFTAKRFPKTAAFFQGLNNLVLVENNYMKNHFKRPHPFELDPVHVKRIVIAPPGYSYPSYHSARCVVFENVLATLDPVHRKDFELVSEQVEIDRVLGGEHFPSDLEAGKKLGGLIYAALLKDKNFLAAVKELKAAEWTPPPAGRKNIDILVPKMP
ncbi:MAG: hypothetical protein ABI615_06365 [Chthoniobacterales bacterium]